TGHIRSEPDLVEEHRTCTDDFKGCLDGVVGVLAVCLDHVGEVSELDATWLVRATCTAGGQDICHLDDTSVLCCECEVGDCCLTGAHLVRSDKGHTDLHCRPPGGRSTVAGPADGCRDVDCLPHGLADCGLEGGCLLCREEFVEVQDELGLEVVCHLVIAGEDFDVAVVDECRVGLDHVFLNNGCAGHGVV